MHLRALISIFQDTHSSPRRYVSNENCFNFPIKDSKAVGILHCVDPSIASKKAMVYISNNKSCQANPALHLCKSKKTDSIPHDREPVAYRHQNTCKVHRCSTGYLWAQHHLTQGKYRKHVWEYRPKCMCYTV